MGYPLLKEAAGTGVSHGGGEGNGLRPERGAVDTRQVCVAVVGGEGADDVDLDM